MAGREDIFQREMNKGHSAAWDQLWDKAAAAYRAALTEMPDNPKALSSLALALYQLLEFEDAMQTYRRLAKISPDDPIPFEKIAQISERLGNLDDAVNAAIKAADLYLAQKDVEKAIENWSRVTQLRPENILAHSRLALVHERLRQSKQAVTEYLALASLMQRAGKLDKAAELVGRALKLMPGDQASEQAKALLASGQLLPKPIRPKGGTGPLRMAQVKQISEPKKQVSSGLDPVDEARKKALTILAEILFEYSDESDVYQERKGLQAIMHGTGELSLQQMAQTKIIMHLGQAIDAQSKGQDESAAEELAQALLAGFEHPALYFSLGMLRVEGGRADNAISHLQHAVKHVDFGLAARLLLGRSLRSLGRLPEAAAEYLEALKLADGMMVPADQADALRQLYEPLIEALAGDGDAESHERLCDNVDEMLMRDDWRNHLQSAREELPKSDGEVPLPIAEILIEAQSGQVLGAMSRVHELARHGHMRSAMDEAFQAITYAPTYLPLHSLIGDLLIQDGRTDDAIAKFGMVAESYSVRGEANQSTVVLRKIINLAPMDLSSRTKLIDQLTAHGQIDDAIREYLNLADIYYRLAELDMARKTYTTALRAAQQGSAERSWNVHILQRMADIDMQRLDWRRALRVFEQIRTLRPDDSGARRSLIDLNLKMANRLQALKELDSYRDYLSEHPATEDNLVGLLADLLMDHSSIAELHLALGEEYAKSGKTNDAIQKFDRAAELYLEVANKESAIEAIMQILKMNPPNQEEYQQVLAQIQAS
jgi:tetratricopeptide (TPR) repeat protein